jgi:hypothetical protein
MEKCSHNSINRSSKCHLGYGEYMLNLIIFSWQVNHCGFLHRTLDEWQDWMDHEFFHWLILKMSHFVLPDDVLFEILSFLPGTRLDVMRRVSRGWNNIICTRKDLWKCVCTTEFPNMNILLYSSNFRDAYIDLYKRHDRDPKHLFVLSKPNSDTMAMYEIDPEAENDGFIVDQTQIGELSGDYLVVSPNGFFVACTAEDYIDNIKVTQIHIKLIQRRSDSNYTVSVIYIRTPETHPFYLYWSPNSRYLTWIGYHVPEGHNLAHTMGLWMIDIHKIVLDRVKPINGNYMMGLENLAAGINVKCDAPLRSGRPMFYNLSQFPRIYIHDSFEHLGYVLDGNYTSLDGGRLTSERFCPPLVLSNGNVICLIKKYTRSESRDAEIVMMDPNGKILYVYGTIGDLGDFYNLGNTSGFLILSPDEKYFAYGLSSHYLLIFGVETKKVYDMKEINPNILDFEIIQFSEYQNKMCLLTFHEDGQTMKIGWNVHVIESGLNWNVSGRQMSQGFHSIVTFLDQYILADQYVNGSYFIVGEQRSSVHVLCLLNTRPDARPRVINEGSHGVFIPNKK